ncbi:MAG TPA: hypothetical protein VKE22_19525 [Haliangiales bacterium]|nr:hypothetical protein [Haliangiales bacterium]
MAREAWIDAETRMSAIGRRAILRALRRPWRVLTIALLITGACVAYRARRSPSYEARLYFLLAEGDITDPNNAPKPLHSIRDYVSNVALSRNRIEQLMKKYHLSPALLARDPVAATDSFREDVEVDVSRNYFIYDRHPGDAPRSAQVTISMKGGDAEQTRAIVHDIGDAILQAQAAQRNGRLARARELLGAQLTLARARIKAGQDVMDRLWLEAAKADPRRAIAIRAQIAAQQAAAKGAIEQLLALERRAADVAFTAAAEGEQLGMNFELFDETLTASAPRLGTADFLRLGAIVFVIVLVLAVPIVGAFDDRVYAPEDLRARGIALFGALPRFPGDDVGSYRARGRATVYTA